MPLDTGCGESGEGQHCYGGTRGKSSRNQDCISLAKAEPGSDGAHTQPKDNTEEKHDVMRQHSGHQCYENPRGLLQAGCAKGEVGFWQAQNKGKVLTGTMAELDCEEN